MLDSLDSWLYANESVYTRQEKSQNFWKSRFGSRADSILFTMRIVACLIWINVELQRVLYHENYLQIFYKFYTNWTFYIWSVWLACIVTSQTRFSWL